MTAPEKIFPDDSRDYAERSLQEALHALAQPLTALSFTLEMGRMCASEPELRRAIESALTETRRAFRAMERVREASQGLLGGTE